MGSICFGGEADAAAEGLSEGTLCHDLGSRMDEVLRNCKARLDSGRVVTLRRITDGVTEKRQMEKDR